MIKIICAANYYNDGKEYVHNPVNIKIGYIICGRRHHNCNQTFAQIYGFPYSKEANLIQQTEIEGFLTTDNRFVDRKEGYQIALDARQIVKKDIPKLYSEDLY
jgi:hypothetical protein